LKKTNSKANELPYRENSILASVPFMSDY